MSLVPVVEVAELTQLGVRAFTTTRDVGTFGISGADPVGDVMTRWTALEREAGGHAMVLGRQVHGATVLEHDGEWSGWLRAGEADGHIARSRGIALTVTVADCVPVFIAHPSGVVGILHSGWRGTWARIIDVAVAALSAKGIAASELHVHLGPAICGRCYEVSADVREKLTGMPVNRPGHVDIRSIIAEHARELGVKHLSVSEYCTRCHNDRFFSHRAGDSGRQAAVIVATRD